MTAMRKVLGLALLVLIAASPLAAQKPLDEVRRRCLGSNPNAPVLIEVHSDYQCPACRQFYLDTIRPVLTNYATAGKVCVVYHEFPLERRHQYARQAARYARAAARLGAAQWFQVTNRLYADQARWSSTGQLDSIVAQALTEKEMSQVRKWLQDPRLDAAIDLDIRRGQRRGVRGTPTIFISANGKTHRLNGPVQYAILRQFLDHLLRQK